MLWKIPGAFQIARTTPNYHVYLDPAQVRYLIQNSDGVTTIGCNPSSDSTPRAMEFYSTTPADELNKSLAEFLDNHGLPFV